MQKYSVQDLNDAQALLDELLREVSSEESTLSGTQDLALGSDAVKGLRRTKVSFGNPRSDLIQLTEQLFLEVGVKLTELQKKQMQDQFDFYYMTLSLSMQPGRGVNFSRVECLLSFGPKGDMEPIVHAMFPKSEWKDLVRLGAGVNLAVKGDLEWSLGIDPTILNSLIELPGNLKARVSNSDNLNAYVTIPDYTFKLGFTQIAATGEGNSDCFWRIERPVLQGSQTVQFGIVFKVPKGQSSIDLVGVATVEPDISWLLDKLRNVFEYLSENLKRLLLMDDTSRKGKNRLPLGDVKNWHLVLPK